MCSGKGGLMNPFVLCIKLLLLSVTLLAAPMNWEFPSDHGIHPDYDTEWYYITGHLVDTNNTLHGFQVTFFRHKLSQVKDSTSLWNSPHLYTAHFAFTNGETDVFYHDETMGRASFGLADGETNHMNIYINDWQLNMVNNTIQISIKSKEHDFKLNVTPSKPILFHGDNGFSQKSTNKDRFSYYYSFTRLEGNGTYSNGSKIYTFKSASAWMDREIFNTLLDNEQIGWDWFAIQLDDGTDIMAFQVRSDLKTPYYSGTILPKTGKKITLSKKDFSLTPLAYWTSPKSKQQYPTTWQLQIPKHAIDVTIKARYDYQELHNTVPFPFYYWEGQSLVSGSHQGRAYMELVGY